MGAVVGRTIVEVLLDEGRVYGLRLDDGTVIEADGGEDKDGGYGFLFLSEADHGD